MADIDLGAKVLIPSGELQTLIDVLIAHGYDVLGPILRDGAIVYDEVRHIDDLPRGWTDRQDAGTYRIEKRQDEALFGYAVGPQSWKRFVHPPVDHADRVSAALSLKSGGNQIMRLLGGREIHPVNVRVGGFYRVPRKTELEPLAKALHDAREQALATLEWVSTFTFPTLERDYTWVGLRHPGEYPITEGRIVSNTGLDIAVADYEENFIERQVSHSTALHSVIQGGGSYLVGPLARYSLNFERLPAAVRRLATEAGLEETCRNPFKSILVRSVELVFACEEALRLIHEYEMPDRPHVEVGVRAGM
jgi:coenzyme F420-reducing hydrogenase alpha subunit